MKRLRGWPRWLEQSPLAAQVKNLDVPRWDESILKARCETAVNGFISNHILTTRLHGASLGPEIERISQPLKLREDATVVQVRARAAG